MIDKNYLRRIVNLNKNETLKKIKKGLSAEKYYQPENNWLLRVYSKSNKSSSIRANNEKLALELLEDLIFAPNFIKQYETTENIVNCIEWVKGIQGKKKDCVEAISQISNAQITRDIVDSKKINKLYNHFNHKKGVERYLSQISTKLKSSNIVEEKFNIDHGIFAAISEKIPDTEKFSVIHGDLHPQNCILSSSGPVLIDWEFASYGEKYFDLAYLMVYDYYKFKKTPEYFLNSGRGIFKNNKIKEWIPTCLGIMGAWFIDRWLSGGRKFNLRLSEKYLNASLNLIS